MSSTWTAKSRRSRSSLTLKLPATASPGASLSSRTAGPTLNSARAEPAGTTIAARRTIVAVHRRGVVETVPAARICPQFEAVNVTVPV
jgi:hypothetical protein